MRNDPMLQTAVMEDVMEHYNMLMRPEYSKKKNLGQVFTPLDMVNKIVDKIPLHIMRNPHSTFFDPSAGMGGFLMVIYYRLMKHLARNIPNKCKRHTHIVNKMLYASEITLNNVNRMKNIFGQNFNVYHGDTLHINTFKAFGVHQFAVIVGNPPFEKPQISGTRKQGGSTLWIDFVHDSIKKWLCPGGYMGMLLPPGWRKPTTQSSRSKGLWDIMTRECTMLWVDMYDDKQCKKIFGTDVSIRFDLIFLRNSHSNGHKTFIQTIDGMKMMEDLRSLPFLPNGHLDYWKSVLTNDKKKSFKVISSGVYDTRSKRIRRHRTSTFRFPVIHAIHKDKSKVLLYTNERLSRGGFHISKLIFNGYGGWNEPVLDMDGKYGMSEVVFGLVVKSASHGQRLYDFFKKTSVLELFQSDMVWSTSRPLIFWGMFNNIKKDIYKYKISSSP